MKEMLKRLNIKYPIIQGGMGNVSAPSLVASVSEAGGLGTIGCGTMEPKVVDRLILETKDRTDKPFALNIPLSVNAHSKELMDLAIQHDIKVVSLSAGNPNPYISILKEKGITVMAVVASVGHATKAEAAGADLLVAEGFEAAGINSPVELTTFTLVPQICKHVSIPVVAAGGIADGYGLAAALMLGASGVQMGTRFIATEEAPYHALYKEKVLQATELSTIVLGRPHGQVRRVLKGVYSEKLLQVESSLDDKAYREHTSEHQHQLGAVKGDDTNGFMNSGQIAGLIDDLPTVKDLIKSMMNTARQQLDKKRKEISALTE
ncbi:NAD(P)H-dependent flavin oxidoreductase [Shouchella patagoniensis]|uniref:NAD(P)H-dependent flavin oxidoreductase n=1 Tax=Shouchella patagoniensis TaxID=228576 RepID=UPI000994CDEC|nr:nitronate monooxygenase [Shouchella patagoniensis]